MMPNNRNLGRGRFHSAVSVMQWFILRCETQQKETFCELPVHAARCSVLLRWGKERLFRLRDRRLLAGRGHLPAVWLQASPFTSLSASVC